MSNGKPLPQTGADDAPTGRSGAPAGGPLRHRWWIAAFILVVGLWVFSDWLFLWSGHSRVVATEATIVKSLGIEHVGKSNKYRHVISYPFPAEQFEGAPGQDANSEPPVADADGNLNARMNVLLEYPLAVGSTVPVEYIYGQPWKLYRLDGALKFSDLKLYYLFGAFIILCALFLVKRRR